MTFEVSSCTKFQIFRGSAPRPHYGPDKHHSSDVVYQRRVGAYSTPQTLRLVGRGLAAPLPKNPTSAFRASAFWAEASSPSL